MLSETIVQGRNLSGQELAQIQALLVQHPSWHRTRLSRNLCELWGWRNEAGWIKDMACRSLLLKLEARGLIGLPPRQRPSVNRWRNGRRAECPHDASVLDARLETLSPLRMEPVASGGPEGRLFGFLLQRYHYLGHRNEVGENLKYLVCERGGRPLACVLFGSAAWKCQVRDAFIGWNSAQRQRHLRLLTNNTRLLILPWVRVPHLATEILSRIAWRLSQDWQDKYGHPIYLLESFVQRERFAGACYRAADWRVLGATTGRGRNSTAGAAPEPVKDVYVQPLRADFRQRLCA